MTPTTRIVVVLVVAALVAGAVMVARRRPVPRPRRIAAPGLGAGVYLFTSRDCTACSRARTALEDRTRGFEELAWDTHPDWFETLGIDAVPSVVIVADDGTGRWFRGGVPVSSQIPRRHRSGE